MGTASVALCLLALSAPTASALGTTKAVSCAFSGLTGRISPNDPRDFGFESLATAKARGHLWPMVADTGRYTLMASGTCAVESGDTAHSGATIFQLQSSGTYRNFLCGNSMGFHGGTDYPNQTSITFGNGAPDLVDVQYSIGVDAAGQAAIYVAEAFDSSDGTRLTGRGYATVYPSRGNCVNQDVSEWTFVGAIALSG